MSSFHAYQKIFSNLINKQKLTGAATLTMEISIPFFAVPELAVDLRRLHEGNTAVITACGGLVSGGTLGLVNNVPCYYEVRRCPASPAGPSGEHTLPSLTVVPGWGWSLQGHKRISLQTSHEASESDAPRRAFLGGATERVWRPEQRREWPHPLARLQGRRDHTLRKKTYCPLS